MNLKKQKKKVAYLRRKNVVGKAIARLFQLSEPINIDVKGREYKTNSHFVIVSCIYSQELYPYTCETLIFSCDKDGYVEDFQPLFGSVQGVYSATKALQNAGYEIINE